MWKLWKSDESDRLIDAERRLKQLESDFKSLELEWDNVWTKVRKALGRIYKTEALENGPKIDSNQQIPIDAELMREQIVRRAGSVRP